MNETHADCAAGALENRFHQPAPYTAHLDPWINRNWSETTDRITFVEEIRADDLTITLGDDAEYRGMSYAEIRALDGNFHTWKLRWKPMAVKDAVERFVNNASTGLCISCDCWADCCVHLASSGSRAEHPTS